MMEYITSVGSMMVGSMKAVSEHYLQAIAT